MGTIHGVTDIGFSSHLTPVAMIPDGASAILFQDRGVPVAWGAPSHVVAWLADDGDGAMGGAVARYRDGREAYLRIDLHGHWSLTFGKADSDKAPVPGERGEDGKCPPDPSSKPRPSGRKVPGGFIAPPPGTEFFADLGRRI